MQRSISNFTHELAHAARSARITKAQETLFDVAIIGGGIHGACVAREAILRGCSVLLLEATDYAFGTSSRSSKMYHGGLRYLEQFEFGLVREALSEREIGLRTGRHLARPQKFLFPIIKGQTRPAWQIAIGLRLYDVLSKAFHKKVKGENLFPSSARESLESPSAKLLFEMGLSFSALFSYYDAQMDDARIVVENVVDAAALGAVTLNHAKVTSFERDSGSGVWSLHWSDSLTKQPHLSRAKYIINTAGPWVPQVHDSSGKSLSTYPQAIFSRGTHLLFDVSWPIEGLFLPTGTPGRNYWVLPFFSPRGRQTLVGTTDVSVERNEDDPQPSESEILELLSFIKRDLPHSELARKSFYKAFAGMRILARKRSITGKNSSSVSRKDVVISEPGYVTLVGGKYTTARHTAEKLFILAAKEIGKAISGSSQTRERSLPGAVGYSEIEKARILGLLRARFSDASEGECLAVINRFGVKAQVVIQLADELGVDLSQAQKEYAVRIEQAVDEEDILRRRLLEALLP